MDSTDLFTKLLVWKMIDGMKSKECENQSEVMATVYQSSVDAAKSIKAIDDIMNGKDTIMSRVNFTAPKPLNPISTAPKQEPAKEPAKEEPTETILMTRQGLANIYSDLGKIRELQTLFSDDVRSIFAKYNDLEAFTHQAQTELYKLLNKNTPA